MPDVPRFREDVRFNAAWHHMENVDAVLHLAAYQDYQTDYGRFFETNVTSTAHLYEFANHTGWKGRVVVASSSSTMGEGVIACDDCGQRSIGQTRRRVDMQRGYWNVPCVDCGSFNTLPVWTHEDEWYPITPYGVSKQAQEQTALTIGRLLDIPTVALRYSIVQGAGQSPWNAYSGVMRASCLQILADRDVVIFEDGQQLRDFVSIHDVVDANVRALEGEIRPGGYNVSGGTPWSVMDLVAEMIAISGRDVHMTTPGVFRVGDVRHTLSDPERLSAECAWTSSSSSRIVETTWAPYWSWLTSLNLDAERIVDDAFDNMRKSGVLVEANL
jgi:dTDP-L-rhamnose 4-epimerase